MYLKEIQPDARLRPYIRSYLFISLKSGDFVFPADGCPGLIINYGDPFLLGFNDGKLSDFVGCRLFGSTKRHLLTKHIVGRIDLVAVKFHSGQLRRFFNVPASELTDKSVSLHTILGMFGKEMEQRCYETRNASKIKWLLDYTFVKLLSDRNACDNRISVALYKIWCSKGQISIEELAKELNLSRRHLERRFLDYIGLTPKRMCRIVRFLSIFFPVESIRRPDWADLAIAGGYSDQAHFIRECKYFTGHSPLSYYKDRSPLENMVMGTVDTMSHFFNTVNVPLDTMFWK